MEEPQVHPDTGREARTGQPEVIYGPGKTAEQMLAVARDLLEAGVRPILASRVTADQAEAFTAAFADARYHETANLIVLDPAPPRRGTVAVVAAGTSDLPVAEEAASTAAAFGLSVERITDVGVAGVHRVLARVPTLERMDAVIVVAGMEGALPSVIAGLVSAPVIAVPTSVGYGAAFEGLAALLGMLSSCVPGVVVVNIDNGLGAAMAAHRMISG
ncbi:MAG: nickel pincer cofactor biosynthesis protein LarB [Actinomycetota bacterium]